MGVLGVIGIAVVALLATLTLIRRDELEPVGEVAVAQA